MLKVRADLPRELFEIYKHKIKLAHKVSQMHAFLEDNEYEGKMKDELALVYANLMKEINSMFIISYPKISEVDAREEQHKALDELAELGQEIENEIEDNHTDKPNCS